MVQEVPPKCMIFIRMDVCFFGRGFEMQLLYIICVSTSTSDTHIFSDKRRRIQGIDVFRPKENSPAALADYNCIYFSTHCEFTFLIAVLTHPSFSTPPSLSSCLSFFRQDCIKVEELDRQREEHQKDKVCAAFCKPLPISFQAMSS